MKNLILFFIGITLGVLLVSLSSPCKHIYTFVEPEVIFVYDKEVKSVEKDIVCVKCHKVTRQIIGYSCGVPLKNY